MQISFEHQGKVIHDDTQMYKSKEKFALDPFNMA